MFILQVLYGSSESFRFWYRLFFCQNFKLENDACLLNEAEGAILEFCIVGLSSTFVIPKQKMFYFSGRFSKNIYGQFYPTTLNHVDRCN